MKTLQLQFFDHASRAYVADPHSTVDMANSGYTAIQRALEMHAERARRAHPSSLGKGHKAWRIASTERALKPKYNRSGFGARRGGPSRTIEQIQCEYVEWAKAKGLTHITIYRSDAGRIAFVRWYGEKTYITPEEQFAVRQWEEPACTPWLSFAELDARAQA